MLCNYGKDYRMVIPPGCLGGSGHWDAQINDWLLSSLPHSEYFLDCYFIFAKSKTKNTHLHLLSTTLGKTYYEASNNAAKGSKEPCTLHFSFAANQ